MKDILADNFATRRLQLWQSPTMRIVNWNIDRGLRLNEIIDFLASQNADLLVLQEVDLNARRTKRVNVAEEIARQLGMNYVFGREFEELTQGSSTSPAYHGQATLSRWPLADPRLIRFHRQSNFWRPRWFLPRTEPFQERLGGRIALVTQIEGAARGLRVYNMHLESRGNNDLRLAQLDEVLRDSAKFAPRAPTLLAGDLNFDASVAFRTGTTAKPYFRSALGPSSPHTTTPRGLLRRKHSVDWAFVSGPVSVSLGRVHDDINASDHYPVSFTIRFS